MLSHAQKTRYARHLIMPEIGAEGQQKIIESKVLVIGAGGLGSPCLFYLASSGVGTIGIADFDRVEVTNLQRQIIHEESDVGRNKAQSAADSIFDINSEVKTEIYKDKITSSNAEEIFKNYDLVIDGSDNFETRFLISDVCNKLKIPLVTAAILKFEGQAAVFRPWLGADFPCYRCLFADVPPEGTMPNCSTNGIFAPVAGIMGSMQANLALKILSGADENIDKKLFIFDSNKMQMRTLNFKKDASCVH